jgi:hypothetical protein
LHAFGERAGGFKTGIIEYPAMVLEPHVIDTFSEADDPDAGEFVASIEKAIGPLPILTGPHSWSAIAAAKPREYIHELNSRRELNLALHPQYPGCSGKAAGCWNRPAIANRQ